MSKHKPGILTAEEVESSDGEIQSIPDEEVEAQKVSMIDEDSEEECGIKSQVI